MEVKPKRSVVMRRDGAGRVNVGVECVPRAGGGGGRVYRMKEGLFCARDSLDVTGDRQGSPRS